MIIKKHNGNLIWYVDFVLLFTEFYEGKGTNLTVFKLVSKRSIVSLSKSQNI